ncbi:nuclear transport factor 2 family protein [Rhizobium alvei]|uniref:Nuclear transport factor 2 family protein n=1 Tax=Rhizobium alvei TaxID=1132659 RepID=A0ABT8YGQ7_9HYPH|nr:nuclear transport factor 2 family protein [Rhizobium alvei]MDO6962848.1 nuclear transport factor 2 family protein [Rhizobium alvei]
MRFDPVAALIAYHDAINRLDFEAIETMFAEDALYVSPGFGGETRGRAAILKAFRDYFARFPDQHAKDDLVEQLGDRSVRSVWRLEATDRTTGEVIRRNGEEVTDFDDAGRIVRVTVFDRG